MLKKGYLPNLIGAEIIHLDIAAGKVLGSTGTS
jgi:hypothetical protein